VNDGLYTIDHYMAHIPGQLPHHSYQRNQSFTVTTICGDNEMGQYPNYSCSDKSRECQMTDYQTPWWWEEQKTRMTRMAMD